MTHDDPLIRALVRLLSSAGRVPTAEFSASERSALVEFSRSNGGLRLVMVGRKSDYAITNRAALERHINQLQPGAWVPNAAAPAAPPAASSAASDGAGVFYLLLKAISPDACWTDGASMPPRTLQIASQQQSAGVAALALRHDDAWHSDGVLWVVEQQAQFDTPDWLPVGATGTLAYCVVPAQAGLRQWLAHSRRASEVRHVAPRSA
ncbi:hypothetical protein [Niveibacterium sp.]|uniref:hypothetical protein n=1 Tax=Niveibacterium sp. TaxID=2017444 RepID=UPI0035B240F3